jgi:hypothetical protein
MARLLATGNPGALGSFWLGLTLTLGLVAAEAQNRPPQPSSPPTPSQGPPPDIDGPLPPAEPLPAPSSQTPLVLPGTAPLDPPWLADEWLPEGDVLFTPPMVAGEARLNPYKDGFFQKLSLSTDWLGNSADPADLGLTEVDTYVQVGLPAPLREWPLLITAGWNLTLINGPTVTDLPPRLYLAYADFMWLPQVVRGYTVLLSVVPSVFGDFQEHQFRLTGKGLLICDLVPQRLQLVAGVLYLNRENLRLLPAGGAIWTPEDWLRLELLFPKPKFAFRYHAGPGFEDWVYATAEFGGNTWPIERADGTRDNMTYLDYRLLVGTERKLDGGAGYRLEFGYVLGRDLSFTSGRGDFAPQDSFLLRGGITY